MYKYTLVTEQEDKLEKFQESRIKAFDEIEEKLKSLSKSLIKIMRDNFLPIKIF